MTDRTLRRSLVAVTTDPAVVAVLAAGLPDDVDLYRDFGLDAPIVTGRCSWRVAPGHAARLVAAGVELNLSAPGPHWLAALAVELTGRRVWSGTVAELSDAPRHGYAKPADAKVPALPARWYERTSDFAEVAHQLLGGDAHVQVADRLLDIDVEFRSFVVDRRAVTTSAYVRHDGTRRRTYEPSWDHDPRVDAAAAHRYANAVTIELGDAQPNSYALDIARLTDGRHVVIEANAAWGSGAYRSDPHRYVAAVLDASDSCSDHGNWRWDPDPYHLRLAARLGPLRRWAPDWDPVP
jgi:hypothetical protein